MEVQQRQRLKEAASPDDHEELGEQVKVCLEVLHGPVVHQLLADLPRARPPEEHVHHQQEQDRSVEYCQRSGANLIRKKYLKSDIFQEKADCLLEMNAIESNVKFYFIEMTIACVEY